MEGLFRKAPLGVGGLVILFITAPKLALFYLHGEAVATSIVSVFTALSFWMMISPFVEYRSARKTTFCITDRRLIIAKRNGQSTKSIRLGAVKQVERIRKRSGITLRIPTALVSDSEGGQKVDYTDLYGLEDGEEAYRLLTEVQGLIHVI